MKKYISLILVLIFVLTGCGSKGSEEKEEIEISGYINGEVKSILGNEVVIEGVNMNLSEMEDRNSNRDNTSGERPEGERGMGNNKISREEFTLTIPVGIEVVEVTVDADNNRVEEEASFSDITKGKNINIAYTENIEQMIKVSIIDSSSGARGMFPGAGGFGGSGMIPSGTGQKTP